MHKALRSLHEDSRSLWLPQFIQEYHSPPSTLSFLRTHVSQSVPCVWRQAASSWKAISSWHPARFAHLREKVGHRNIQVTHTPDGRADAVVQLQPSQSQPSSAVFAMPEQRHETLSQLMDQLLRHQAHRQHSCDCTDVPYCSAQDSSLVRDVPQLMEDIREDTLHFASEAFGSQPSVKNIWIGDERSVSSMHADPYENLYTVVTGIKIFYLRPPCDAALLDKPVLQNARWKASANEMHDELCESCVQPVEMYEGWSLVKEEGETAWIDENSCEAEYDQCLQVHLHAGDVLYLPALWCTFTPLSLWRPKPCVAFHELTFPFTCSVLFFGYGCFLAL